MRRRVPALLAVLGLAAPTNAQDVADVEEVVVTGSFIAGTPEDAALPVNVIGADEMQKQGSPSTVDLLKAIPAVSSPRAAASHCDNSAAACRRGSSRTRMHRRIDGARTRR